jgi:hypothetical protein
MATPEQIQEVRNLFNIAYPAKPPFDSFVPSAKIAEWLNAGNSPQKISAGLVQGMQALNFPVDPPGGPTAGQWTGARLKALTGHYTLQDSIEPYFLEGRPMPADSYIRSRTISGLPSVNYDGSPAEAPKPETGKPEPPKPVEPEPRPETASPWATVEQFNWLKNLVLGSVQPRLDRLDAAVPPKTAGPAGPGIG